MSPFVAHQWQRHQAGLNRDGQSVCVRCGVELPRLIPVNQTVCTKEDRLFLGDRQEARDCAV